MSGAGKLLVVLTAMALSGVSAARAQPAAPDGPADRGAGAAAPAESALALSRRGLTLLDERRHQAAAETLERALESGDSSLDLPGARDATRYNLALARARAGDLPAASQALDELEAAEVDPSLRARARFNRGHALFSEAQQMAESDASAAIERYLRAAEAFRLAAAMGADDAARAARNVEISRLAAQRLRDRLQREQERQQQARQMAEELRDLAEQQQQLADEAESRAESEQPTDDLQQQQDDLRQRAQDLLDQMRDMAEHSRSDQRDSEQTPEEAAADDIERATAAQDQASRDLGEQRTEDAATEQQRAADLLRQAADRLAAGQSEERDGQEGQQQEQDGQQDENAQSQQEGEGDDRDAIAEYLLDKERAEREARQHIRGRIGRIVPVEKDW